MASTKQTRQQKELERLEALQTKKEIWGVALIALGVFFAFCQYFSASGVVGEYVTGALYGLFGAFFYALPPAMAVGGVMLIASALKPPRRGRIALIMLLLVLIVGLIHVIVRPVVKEVPFFAYVKDAYSLGERKTGGGAVGALPAYLLLYLMGEAGAYIFLIAGMLISLLLITRISLRETGRQVRAKVKEGVQYVNEKSAARKRPLYTETLDETIVMPVDATPRNTKPRRKSAPLTSVKAMRKKAFGDDGPEFFPQEGELLPRNGKTEAAEGAQFLPTEGPIARRKDNNEAPPWDEKPEEPSEENGPVITYYEETYHAGEPEDFETSPVTLDPLTKPIKDQAKNVPQTPLDLDTQEQKPYVAPSFSLLNPPSISYGRTMDSPTQTGKLLIDTLETFNVKARIVNISVGPVITRFEIAPAPGVRVNKITVLSDDIALALAAPRVRIEAPIPGKAAVGVEVPNKDAVTVVLRDIVESKEFQQAKSPITLALGKDIAGKIIVSDLAKMPHLLIAGQTGSGKSVCINDIIISLVYKCTPDELKLILVDPKVVELSAFGVLPHLAAPVVTDPKKAAGALASGVREMTERYQKFAKAGARDLARYNELQQDPKDRLPKLVIIIDELADLMMVAPDTVEDSICRIAQLGRAAGIHLIVATQRPSADVITGLIKANIPSRIAFAVASAIDSRIILDSGGAEKLLGRGDMLFQPNGGGKPIRAQGAFVSDEEVERIAAHFRAHELNPSYNEQLVEEMDNHARPEEKHSGNTVEEDELLGEAVRIVLDSGQASISMIQRRLRVGYARAARLVDIMERRGYVSGFDGSKPRKLLITRAQYAQIFGDADLLPVDESMEAPDDEV
ncbi:DNA translocase FtsK [Eubacteriales bacterium OttesenSCG-928-K08]|nr:DNA translocase FtsK [Eubacteriales bacterium OttesenSCG-928-K08]